MTDTEDEYQAFARWYEHQTKTGGVVTAQQTVDRFRLGKKWALEEKADMKQAGTLTFQERKRIDKNIAMADAYIDAIIKEFEYGIEGAMDKVHERYPPESD